jgi:hypothetical protein
VSGHAALFARQRLIATIYRRAKRGKKHANVDVVCSKTSLLAIFAAPFFA